MTYNYYYIVGTNQRLAYSKTNTGIPAGAVSVTEAEFNTGRAINAMREEWVLQNGVPVKQARSVSNG